ncbi:putative coatomer subunit alpha [Gracilariopsis chorda]|uniref:Putative coatomer subunit alpha n=1 Tax=Gracilariopsis chorda TaxID=448386 RepID=A0A2V3IWZ0_9FLOR|nr:putative coatomer subunit alpha [Gracilariopsis chorda]|eukprot:PXF46207.1 putative coatomer subunit alpha [Gracilariopsis chorda]
MAGPGAASRWKKNGKLAGELVAAGAFKEAMTVLKDEIGAGSFSRMKEAFMSVYGGCRGALDGVPNTGVMTAYIARLRDCELEAMSISLKLLRERYRHGER